MTQVMSKILKNLSDAAVSLNNHTKDDRGEQKKCLSDAFSGTHAFHI